VFTNICSLLIDKDGYACRNFLIKFACACPTVIFSIFGKSFHFPFLYLDIFKIYLKRILLFEAETWTTTKKGEGSKIQAMEIKFFMVF